MGMGRGRPTKPEGVALLGRTMVRMQPHELEEWRAAADTMSERMGVPVSVSAMIRLAVNSYVLTLNKKR